MAKVSMVEREKKRAKIVAKYAAKRAALKAIINDREASDDERWDAQLKLQKERGTDMTIFSPRAVGMGHHLGTEQTSYFWAEISNNMVRRVCDMYPDRFVPVCQLPQYPGVEPAKSIPELGSPRR